MKYHLVLEVKEGEYKGKFVHLDFSADSDGKALSFGEAMSKLEMMDKSPIKFGDYAVRKRTWLLSWKTLIYHNSREIRNNDVA